MSQTTVAPSLVPATTQTVSRTMMVAVALVSFSSLILELALTRLFSVVLFYHLAFFAISVALLGLGSGGVFAHLCREWLQTFETRPLAAFLCIINSICILAAVEVVLHTPVSLAVTAVDFDNVTIIYLATAVPFFITGLLFSVLFARSPSAISILYGADLAGGASACLAVVPLLNLIGAPNALLGSSLAMAIAAILWAGRGWLRAAAVGAIAGFALLLVANHSGRLVDIVYARGLLRDPKWVEFAKWNAISRIEVDKAGGARAVVIDADAATAIMNTDPARWDQELPAHPAAAGFPARAGFNWKKGLMGAAPSVANVLRPRGEFAIIGPGGGVDVLRAVANGSPNVTGIEINPIIINDVMRGRYADYSFHLYDRPEVHIHIQDGRSYIRSSADKYDVVQMTLVDTWATTAAGAFALSENNLYTVEAFREYFDHLKPDGMIAITRWEFSQPREALRVVSLAIESLHQMGVADPRRHFVVVAEGFLNVGGRAVLVLAKKSALTAGEYSSVAEHVRHNPNLVWLNPPPQYAGLQNLPPAAQVFQKLIESNDPQRFARDYPYNVSPVHDNAPFFFFTLKTGQVIRNFLAGTRGGIDWKVNVGVMVLGVLLIVSVAAVLAFLIFPLALHRSVAPRKEGLTTLLYFIAVGLGYITVEISLIQRFVLFLGHPTYALTVVVFLLLLSSGAGSVAAQRWVSGRRRLLPLLGLIAGLILVNVLVLPSMLSASVGLPFPVKLAIGGVVLMPLGFLMGMPFPTGLRLVQTVEWAWALNAAASVLGSVLAMIVAIHFGLTATLVCASAAYLLAALCSRTWRPAAVGVDDARATVQP